jgi:hypothetical protein
MPLTIHGTYQAALMHIKLADEKILTADWQNDFHALKSMLNGFSRRWALAGTLP